jgi:hypothetical protein
LPPRSTTSNWESILTTTLANYRPTLKDQIFNQNVTYYTLRKQGQERLDGGFEIYEPLNYEKNLTVGSIGKWDVIDTAEQDTFTNVKYDWKMIAGSVAIAYQDILKNSGKSQLINLLKAKVNVAQNSMAEEVNKEMWKLTPGTNDLLSIPIIIAYDPTASSTTCGGINQSTYSWWRNRYKNSAGTTFAAWQKEIAQIYNDCSKGVSSGNKMGGGRDNPNLIIADQATYEQYAAMAFSKGEIGMVRDDNYANLGFENLKYRRAIMLWDEYVPDDANNAEGEAAGGTRTEGSMYFLNTNYLHMVTHRDCDMKIGPFIEPADQLGKVAKLSHYSNLTCSNRQKQGILGSISLSITS